MNNLPSPAEYERFYNQVRGLIAQGSDPWSGGPTDSLLNFFDLINREFLFGEKTYRVVKATLVDISRGEANVPGGPHVDILPTT